MWVWKKNMMKIKFHSDDNLSLNKILKLHNLTVIARSVFEEDGKYPAGKYWSPGCLEDVPCQCTQDVP